jgi:molecular chaperone HtpG
MSNQGSNGGMDSIDFMRKGQDERVKREIAELINSYDNPWDVLAELAQNSVDAIKQWNNRYKESADSRDHEIRIHIDKESRRVSIEDTGIGITPATVPGLLAPHGTDKSGNPLTIGEKGVGLTFCLFSSNHFRIHTNSVDGEFAGTISGARDWWNSEDPALPQVDPEIFEEEERDAFETRTKIELGDLDTSAFPDGNTLFDINTERIVYLIRTKTALGYIRSALRGEESDKDPDISVYLTLTDGEEELLNSREIEFRYKFPHEFFNDEDTVDITQLRSELPLDDDQKSERLHMNNLKVTGKEERSGDREVRFYAFYMPGGEWEKLSEQNDLTGDSETVYDVDAGIYIATRGMPTGVKIEAPRTGFPGYWSGIYMILEYDQIPFDLGRKSLTGRKGMLKDVAKNVFNEELLPFIPYIRRAPPTSPTDLYRDRFKRFRELQELSDLNYDGISFKKQPDSQEAGVVSIFHELVGSGDLKYYQGLRSGYKQDYDFWGHYRISEDDMGSGANLSDFHEDDVHRDAASGEAYVEENIVIEFKYECADILDEFSDKQKEFDAIDIIVCWNLDESAMSNITVTENPPGDTKYAGCNYEIVVPNDTVVSNRRKYVIELKTLLETL